MTKSTRKKTEDFIERVSKQLDNLNLSEKHKKTIIELLEIELSTGNKDVISDYREIIRIRMEGK
tara:strand:+ start:6702 stop:6893 length:192 start_codon:yes stop_codon:yes gene_type:complete